MRTIVVQADDPVERYPVLRRIQRRWGHAARLVVQEFLANAAERCPDHRVNLTHHRDGIVAPDHGGGSRPYRSAKAKGESGYGLALIRAFGGYVTRWRDGMRLDYRCPGG